MEQKSIGIFKHPSGYCKRVKDLSGKTIVLGPVQSKTEAENLYLTSAEPKKQTAIPDETKIKTGKPKKEIDTSVIK